MARCSWRAAGLAKPLWPSPSCTTLARGTWTATEPMVTQRSYQTATLLPDGTVLVAGGPQTTPVLRSAPLASAELYEPGTRQ